MTQSGHLLETESTAFRERVPVRSAVHHWLGHAEENCHALTAAATNIE
jgi:hypothetical protein